MAIDPASMSSTIPAHIDLRESDTRQGRRLEYFTLGWNLTEAVVAIGAGVIAGSISLIGFGVDSIIESFPVQACYGDCNRTRWAKSASRLLLS
jgi:hypothetical protein